MNLLIEILIAFGIVTLVLAILTGVATVLIVMRRKEDTRFLREAEEQSQQKKSKKMK